MRGSAPLGAGPGKLAKPPKGLPPVISHQGQNLCTLLPDECASLPDEEELLSVHLSDHLSDTDVHSTLLSDSRPDKNSQNIQPSQAQPRMGTKAKRGKSPVGRGASCPSTSHALSAAEVTVPETFTETITTPLHPVKLSPERPSQPSSPASSSTIFIPVPNPVHTTRSTKTK